MKAIKVATTHASILFLAAILTIPNGSGAQTRLKPGMNFFSVDQDIQMGRQAAAQVERQVPMVNDPVVQEWIDQLGHRLASNTSMPNLPWRFRVTNSSQINAFALPGGFVYVNRGLIQITDSESEVAGVMAHEMSHVTLRHGTNQLSKAMLYQAPLSVLGGMGGGAGALGQLGGLGLSMAFLKFSRDAERNADLLGTQTMAKAGYDPQGMVRIFEKLQRQGTGRGTPQFLSDHPNPENRIQRIEQEIGTLHVPADPAESSRAYYEARNRLRDMPAASPFGPRTGTAGRRRPAQSAQQGEPPSRSFQSFRSSNGLFQVGYPSNWEASSQTGMNVTFAPEWAIEGNEVTRGAIVSYFDPQGQGPYRGDRDEGDQQDRYRGRMSLDQAMDTIIDQILQSNTDLREDSGRRYRGRLSGQEALATFLMGRNSLGYDERDWLIVRPSGQGVVYMLFIAPEREFSRYEPTFQSMIRSFQINDRPDRYNRY